jgi:hypothetical protein
MRRTIVHPCARPACGEADVRYRTGARGGNGEADADESACAGWCGVGKPEDHEDQRERYGAKVCGTGMSCWAGNPQEIELGCPWDPNSRQHCRCKELKRHIVCIFDIIGVSLHRIPSV